MPQRKASSKKAPRPAPTLAALRKELHAAADPVDASFLQGFFKTAPGQYGAGDKFLGLRVDTLRRLVRDYPELEDSQALEMLASPWHEERLLALLFLRHMYCRGDWSVRVKRYRAYLALLFLVCMYRRGDRSVRAKLCRAYLAITRYINNRPLVDASAQHIVGAL